MILDQFIQNMEARLYGLGKHFWRDDALAQMQEQADELSTELQARNVELARCRSALVEIRSVISTREMEAALLMSRVETYVHVRDEANAWQHALELDQLHQALRDDRWRLQELQHAEQQQSRHIKQLERSLATLQEKLYVT